MLTLALVASSAAITANAARRTAKITSCSIERDVAATAVQLLERVVVSAALAVAAATHFELSALATTGVAALVALTLIEVVNGARTSATRTR